MRLLLVVFVACFGLAVAQPAFAQPVSAPPAPSAQRQPEVLYTKPSGFWTSNKPAQDGNEYRWRLLAIAGGLIGLTGLGMWRLIKRANDDRNNRL